MTPYECRGERGRSRKHPHYAGRVVVPLGGRWHLSRCTSCSGVIIIQQVMRPGAPGWKVVTDADELASLKERAFDVLV